MSLSEEWCNKSNLLLTNAFLYGPTSSVASILGVGGRDPQILKWVMVRDRVREVKEWEWEGKTPRF
jgi:hypothetical protein